MNVICTYSDNTNRYTLMWKPMKQMPYHLSRCQIINKINHHLLKLSKTATLNFLKQQPFGYHHQPILYLNHHRLLFVRTIINCRFSKPPLDFICWRFTRLPNFFKIEFITKSNFTRAFVSVAKIVFFFFEL